MLSYVVKIFFFRFRSNYEINFECLCFKATFLILNDLTFIVRRGTLEKLQSGLLQFLQSC